MVTRLDNTPGDREYESKSPENLEIFKSVSFSYYIWNPGMVAGSISERYHEILVRSGVLFQNRTLIVVGDA